MSRRSRLIVIVAAGGLSCAGPAPLPGNPPPPGDGPLGAPVAAEPTPVEAVVSGLPPLAERQAAVSAEPLPETAARAAARGASLNPTDVEGRLVYLSHPGESCYVELPFPPGELVPPGSAPPRQEVTCPEIMADPAWLACLTGTILTAGPDDAACLCEVMGNPPPPTRWVHCPEIDG